MKFVDLFCGIGGASYGALAVGLEPILLVDHDPAVKSALSDNLEHCFVQSDLRHFDEAIASKISGADVLLCSPPCQSYSRLRTRNSEAILVDDDLKFISNICSLIETCNFKAVLVENVPTFLKSGQGTAIIDCLLRLGFSVSASVLDAANFGVPQRRSRSVILATKSTRKIGIAKENPSVRDAFQDLPELDSGDPLHVCARKHSALVMERIKNIPKDGGSRSSLPPHLVLECHKKTNGYRDVYGRMSWDRPAPTITSGCTNPSKGRFLHPDENRAISLREAARLQTLPDHIKLEDCSSQGKKAQFIGNAFPSKMVESILEQAL